MTSGSWIQSVIDMTLTVSVRDIADFIVNGLTLGTITSGDLQLGLGALFNRVPKTLQQIGLFYRGYIFEPSTHQANPPSVLGHANLFPEDFPPKYNVYKWLNPNNWTSTRAPANTDDSTQGFGPGSMWINGSQKHVYICSDSTINNATWLKLL